MAGPLYFHLNQSLGYVVPWESYALGQVAFAAEANLVGADS